MNAAVFFFGKIVFCILVADLLLFRALSCVMLDSHDGRVREQISDVTCDVFGISPRLAFTLQRRRWGRICPTLAPRSVGDSADGRGHSAVEVTLRKMDVARKRRLAAMAVALEESAEDKEESGLCSAREGSGLSHGLPKSPLGCKTSCTKSYSPAIPNSTSAC